MRNAGQWVASFCLLAAGTAAAETYDSGGTARDFQDIRVARVDEYHGHYTAATNRLNALVARSPNFAGAYFARAVLLTTTGRFAEAQQDIDRVEQAHPETSESRLLRAALAIRQHDAPAALAAVKQIPALPMRTVWKNVDEGLSKHGISQAYVYTSLAEQMLGHDDAALDAFKQEMVYETVTPWYILGRHCFFAAASGLLDMAELTCNEAIAKQGHDIGDYDSLGLAHLKMHKYREAIADYDKALAVRPDLTVSLYGRGMAKRAIGDAAGGNADIAAAKDGEPDIVRIMASYGVPAG